jgi:hypothetical protein
MREHAIPQDVVGYKFHIIGNMTLKQFLEVGAGCIVGFLIYTTNLYAIVKWPLIGVAVAVGAMAAFVPFEERPLDHWILTFFKVLYKPTKFFWKKESHVPEVFNYQANTTAIQSQAEVDLSPYRRERIKEYLVSVQRPVELDSFGQYEQQRVSDIMATFSSITVEEVQAVRQVTRPSLKLRMHSLRQLDDNEPTELEVVSTPVAPLPVGPTIAQQVTTALQLEAIPAIPSLTNQQLAVHQVAQQVEIPDEQLIKVTQPITTSEPVLDEVEAVPTPDQVFSTTIAQPVAVTATQAATSNTELPFPIKPTEPNKLVGMVLTPQNDLLTDAIVEITTAEGVTARAVKTNALGQFFVTTPLPDGTYTILVEKDGYHFPPLALTLANTVIEPLEIRSQA